VTADVSFMVPLVCLFMKTHLLALLQDNCIDLVHCAFLHKLSGCVRNVTAFCQHLLTYGYIGETQIAAWLIYWSISTYYLLVERIVEQKLWHPKILLQSLWTQLILHTKPSST